MPSSCTVTLPPCERVTCWPTAADWPLMATTRSGSPSASVSLASTPTWLTSVCDL
ncbi:MAG: hypothetical protein K2W96_17550 [Gemmataceae bacterium]|nr:hypothetical protein [Gemmataceae bacterium]